MTQPDLEPHEHPEHALPPHEATRALHPSERDPLDSCTACRWYAPDAEHQDFGECRRYPPVPYERVNGGLTTRGARFPLVDESDWCGEHSPKRWHQDPQEVRLMMDHGSR